MIERISYQISLTNLEPLRIGGPEDPLTGADNPIARVGSKVVIPGSTLKGALRAEIERYLIVLHYQGGRWKEGLEEFQPCIPSAFQSLSPDEKNLIKAGKYRQGGNCHYPCPEKRCSKNPHAICPVCYLLGAMGLEGFVRVPFLTTEVAHGKLYSCRIDRATKTVAEGTNRPYELVPARATFTGTLEILKEDPILGWRLGSPRPLGDRTGGDKWLQDGKEISPDEIIKTYIIDRLEAIRFLGGYKSKGFGKVEIKVEAVAK